MAIILKRIFIMIGIALMINGCITPREEFIHAFIGFKHLDKIKLNVANVKLNFNINQMVEESNKNKDARHLLPVSFEDMITSWVDDRIVTSANEGSLNINVEQLEFNENRVASGGITDNAIFGNFFSQQTFEYHAHIRINITGIRSDGSQKSQGVIAISRNLKLPAGLKYNELQQHIYTMEEDIAIDLNQQFEQILDNYFQQFQDI